MFISDFLMSSIRKIKDDYGPYAIHVFRNLSLIFLSLTLLPLTTPVFIALYLASIWLAPCKSPIHRIQGVQRGEARDDSITVLITGVSMQKGLTLARLFHLYGCSQPGSPRIRVIGADFSSLAMGAVSKSVSRFYTLTPPTDGDDEPYVESLLNVIQKEKVDLWVSCSGVASAVEDGVARDAVSRVTKGRCKCVQFGEKDTELLHEKGSFMEAVSNAGLPVPETHVVTERSQVASALAKHYDTGRKFIIKPLGVVDKYRADMTKLPLQTHQLTQKHISRIPISEKDPFILQEFIDGKEYCTHAVILKGKVVAFVACESASVLMHYVALPEESPLTSAMLKFTTRMAEWSQEQAGHRGDGSEFTGHMSFDFLVRKEDGMKSEIDIAIWPIECNPRTHTAVVLFDGDNGLDMIDHYIRYVEKTRSGIRDEDGDANGWHRTEDGDIIYGAAAYNYYWLPHDLVAYLLLPMLRNVLALCPIPSPIELPVRRILGLAEDAQTFLAHTAGPKWRDASLEYWDPLPAWWLWHVFWPAKFIDSLRTGFKWSEVNVSTGKVFGC